MIKVRELQRMQEEGSQPRQREDEMINARFVFKDGDIRDVRLCRPYLLLRIVHAIGYLFRGAKFDGLHHVE